MKDYLFCAFRYDLCNNIKLELDIPDDNSVEMYAHNLLENIHNHDLISVEEVQFIIESSLKYHNISSNEKSLNIIKNIVKYWDKYGSKYDIMANNISVSISLDECEIRGNIDLVIRENENEISIVQFIGSDRKMDSDSEELYVVLYHFYSHLIRKYDQFREMKIDKIIIHSLDNNAIHKFNYNESYENQSIQLLEIISSEIVSLNFKKDYNNCYRCEFNSKFCKNNV